MAKQPLPSIEDLRQLLRYEPETGRLYWNERPTSWFNDEPHCAAWNTRYAGREAFTCTEPRGYRIGRILGKTIRAHIVIWAIHKGEVPRGYIDHINHDCADNRISNLREIEKPENNRNQSRGRNNTSGVVGVIRKRGRWVAQIGVNYTNVTLAVLRR